MSINKDFRTYQRADCAVFRKTAEAFGGLSNMAAGYPVRVNGVRILTVEALYQACRFPHRPEVQQKIIEQSSPMTAKMVGKPFRKDSRPDWDRVRVKIMRWVLRLKLATHWHQFSELLLSTGDRPIVEDSRKDNFWGAVPVGDTSLVGMNVLGRLLMELREEVKQGTDLLRAEPPAISDFRLFDELIGIVDFQKRESEPFNLGAEKKSSASSNISLSLFDEEFIEATTKEISVDSAPNPVFKQRSGVIADLKPYGAYKNSGLAWLGQVPDNWTVSRIKTTLQEVDCRSTDGAETLLSLTRVRGLIPHSDRTEKIHSAKTLVGYKRYLPGNIVMNRMQAWSGMFGAGPVPGLVSPDYAVFRVLGGNETSFVLARVKAPDIVGQFAIESTGIGTGFNRLYSDRLGSISVSLPPPEEQAAIVRFLDWANVRLERTIRAKHRVIALLNEQKQAIIHRAVTRGLDPSAPLKPSGIAWLGDIPEHWEVRRLRTLVYRIEQGVSPLAVGFLAEGNSWGVLKSGCVNRGTFRETEHKQLANSFEIDPAIVVKVGDVLISRACGSPSLVGSVGRVKSLKYRLILSDKTFRAAFRSVVDEDFMVFAMNCRYYRQQVEEAISGADGMANNLPLSSLRSFKFAIPPKVEAVAIAVYLDNETIGIDTAISRLNHEIDLLREYRTRLVADVVTGKLDVREAAAALPAEDAPLDLEPDPLDADTETDDEEATEAELSD